MLAEASIRLEPLDDFRTLRVSVQGSPIDVVVTHLAWRPDAGPVRARQISSLLSWLPRGSAATTLNPAKGRPDRVIDHIFVEPEFFAAVEAHVFGDTPTNGEYPSDHFGVTATVRLR